MNFLRIPATVNTASRIESNGVKRRIHCSEATAEELRRGGKGYWLKPREDKIVAKGKGEMYDHEYVALHLNFFRSVLTLQMSSRRAGKHTGWKLLLRKQMMIANQT